MKQKCKRKKSLALVMHGAAMSSLFLIAAFPVSAGFTRDIVFPVHGDYLFFDDFADPRGGGTREHEANDIFADKMTPVVAAVNGRVRYIVKPEASWGYAIFLEDVDGWQYRYLHLNNDTPGTDDGNGGEQYAYAPGIERGTQVVEGQLLGWVGDSGNAEQTSSHLHFEIRDPQGVAINPYESLLNARSIGVVRTGSSGETVQTIVIVNRGGELVKYASNPKVYYLVNDIKQHIADESSFRAMGFSFTDVRVMPESEMYRTGLPIRLENGAIAVYEDGTPLVDTASGESTVSTGYFFTLDLQIGSKGAEVTELQKVLRQLGYFTYPTNTGYYGSVTADAVRSFQAAQGISPLGIVGPQTRAALNSLY